MAENENIVLLTDDEGNEVEFEHIDTIEMNGEMYVLLLPVKEPDDGVVILKFEESEGEEILVGVEDDNEAQAVLDLYRPSDTLHSPPPQQIIRRSSRNRIAAHTPRWLLP